MGEDHEAAKNGMMKIFAAVVGLLFLLLVIYYFNFTVTSIDRPYLLSGKKETIVATYVDWMCNCAKFVESTKYKNNPVAELDDTDYFFIEPARPEVPWNKDYFIENRYVRLTGEFYIDKGIPNEFELGHIEDKPDHARVFRVDKIEYLTNEK